MTYENSSQRKKAQALKLLKDEDIVFDDDCPEMTPAMEKAFRCAVAQRNRAKKIAN